MSWRRWSPGCRRLGWPWASSCCGCAPASDRHAMSAVPPSRLARGLAATVDWLWRDDPLADAVVERHARRLLLDCLGCAAAALAKPEVARVAAALGADVGPITLPGVADRLPVAHAAALPATAIPWGEACE